MVYALVDIAPVPPNFYVCDSLLYGSTLNYEECLQLVRDLPVGDAPRQYSIPARTADRDRIPYVLPITAQSENCRIVIEISGPNYDGNRQDQMSFDSYLTPDLLRG